MNRPTSPPSRYPAYYRTAPQHRRVRLHGWANATQWTRLHYLRDGAPICEVSLPRTGLQLVGSAPEDHRCTRCSDALAGGDA